MSPAWRYPTAAQLAFDLRNHSQIKLTARSERLKRDSFLTVMKRRFNRDQQNDWTPRTVAVPLPAAPIIAIALDLSEEAKATNEALREAASRALTTMPGARLACINVLRQSYIATRDTALDEEGHNKHVNRLVALQHWAQPLKLREGRITFHVLEAADPATAILSYAEQNRVDQILVGARRNSFARSLLGRISAKVAAEASCTVTVVRPRRQAEGTYAEPAEKAGETASAD